ncbi:MAG: LCP family protein [Synergistales bacterium]|nr:LCP family protein [Synergistales bacterium]
MALLSATVGVAYRLHGVVTPEAEDIKTSFAGNGESTTIDTLHVLLVGVDETEGSHRADTIAVAKIDIDRKMVKLLSLPRDTRVRVPEHGWQKINHAYAYGGVELLEETVVNYLGIPIERYIVLNYTTFPELVDMVGGVDITVKKRLHYVDRAGDLYIDIPEGKQHLDGETALEYVRFRNDAMGDIGRVERQQKLVMALLAKLKRPGMLPKLPTIAKKTIDMLDTDLTVTQAVQLASYLKDLSLNEINFATLPGNPAYISGVSYWLGDLNAASKFLTASGDSDIPGDEDPEAEESYASRTDEPTIPEEQAERLLQEIRSPIAVLNGDGTKGLGRKTATALQKLGIDVAHIGNAKHYDYHFSNIYFPPEEQQAIKGTANSLGNLCGIEKGLVRSGDQAAYVQLIVGHDYERILSRLGGIHIDND